MEPFALIVPDETNLELPDKPVRVLGIDLGTTNSTVAEVVWRPTTRPPVRALCVEIAQETTEGQYIHVLVPSVVAIHSGRVIVGEGAKRLRTRAAELGLDQNRELFYDCKNDIGSRKTYHRAPVGFRSAAEIGGRVLEFLYNSAVANDTVPVAKTVVTVPASFQAAQRKDTLRAAGLAGLELEGGDLLDEPVAAFLDYLMSKGGVELELTGDEKKLVVFDFGGGTCDVAVLAIRASYEGAPIRTSPLSVSRYHRLGGGDIDAAILHEVLIPELMSQNALGKFDLSFEDKKKFIEPALLSVAEALKIGLCTETSRLRQFDRGGARDADLIASRQPGVHNCVLRGRTLALKSPRLTAAQFELLLKPFLDRDLLYARETEYRLTCSVFAPLHDSLKRGGLRPDQVDYCLMIGGSSLIPQVQDAVREFVPAARVLTYDDRDSFQTAVAKGAAYHALARALLGKGLVQPISNDQILIGTASGEEALIPKGVALPYPAEGSYARSHSLAVPETVIVGSLPLRVELVAGEERRMLLSETWSITGPVNRGEPLLMEYRLDENQVLDLRLTIPSKPERGEFVKTINNPLTNVVDPNPLRLEIEDIEEKLRTGQVPRDSQPDVLVDLASKYAELGQREKALEYLKRALVGKGRPDALILHRMALIAGEMGDHEREEKFYREAGSISSWSAPWFNLALMLRQLGRLDEAVESVERAMKTEREAPYLVLRAMLAEKLRMNTDRDSYLAEALSVFDPISAQSDWELTWFLTAARMSGDESKLKEIQDEQRHRQRSETQVASGEGWLPIRAEGIQSGDQ